MHNNLLQIFNEDSFVLILLDFKLLRGNFCREQQVVHLLIVDFKIRTAHQEPLIRVVLYAAENVGEAVWNDASQLWVLWYTHHRVSFAAASLTICKNCSIVAFED